MVNAMQFFLRRLQPIMYCSHVGLLSLRSFDCTYLLMSWSPDEGSNIYKHTTTHFISSKDFISLF